MNTPPHRVARVLVEPVADRPFDYRIPDELAASVTLGSRVTVPLGRSRTTRGYVVGFGPTAEREGLKNILAVEGEHSYLDERMLELVRWMSDYYCAPLEWTLRTVLPGAVRRRGAKFISRRFAMLAPETAGVGTHDALGLALDPHPERPVRVASSVQQGLLDRLAASGGMFVDELLTAAGCTESPLSVLVRRGRVVLEDRSVPRTPAGLRHVLRTEPLALMDEQAQALERIRQTMDEPPPAAATPRRSRVVLLYGVTGSGKTEVYLQAIAHALSRGRGAIVLVPEISLTPQTVERFVARFGDRIAVLHSHLSDGERHDEWHRIRTGEAAVVVGARSAVFAPVPRLGLIVVDEEHEPSYKQEEAPRYHARDVAVVRAQLEDCPVVLGSATPSIESWHNVRKGKYVLATLPHRADHRRMPAMRIVDMRVEAERTGQPSVFSRELLEAMRLRVARAEQTILFLNRRGFSSSLVCKRCGHVASCGQCSVSFTYHRTDERLRCHICGASSAVPARCPACQDPAFKYAGVGTQRVEAIVAKLLPKARVQRMDADVTTRKDAYERIFGEFRTGKIDVLIGTQMIAKGLHFPNVTLVGVINADLSLHLPDFRAGERTYQLLAQVAGRAGRGDVAGEVIVQTFTPHHWAIQAARRLDFEGLCDQELEFRRELAYPPFAHLVCLTLKGISQARVEFAAAKLAQRLGEGLAGRATVAEAAPAPLAKAKGVYRYHVMLRAPSARPLTAAVREALVALKLPEDVTCAVDVDPVNLL